ncbi:MAG: GntR family transcriptional regulator [Clostridiales bacterium]|nr:GntR family transcriptional regulator [Clostridiales bacterium]
MKIILSNYSNVPIYEQIYHQIREGILSGELVEGEVLPSIRQLAKDLQVSVITTTRAYRDLENDGLVAIVQGKGCYVLPQNPELVKEQGLCQAQEHFSKGISAGLLAGASDEELRNLLDILLQEERYGK